ncbi:MAG: hypothetical protein GY758_02050 [Fuerstiella sp.]|nr:hypothetical protein [Fuerstiella sp.]
MVTKLMGSLDGNANDSATDQEIQASDAKKTEARFCWKAGFLRRNAPYTPEGI